MQSHLQRRGNTAQQITVARHASNRLSEPCQNTAPSSSSATFFLLCAPPPPTTRGRDDASPLSIVKAKIDLRNPNHDRRKRSITIIQTSNLAGMNHSPPTPSSRRHITRLPPLHFSTLTIDANPPPTMRGVPSPHRTCTTNTLCRNLLGRTRRHPRSLRLPLPLSIHSLTLLSLSTL